MVPIFCALWFPKTVHYGSRFLCILICRRLCIVISRLHALPISKLKDLRNWMDDVIEDNRIFKGYQDIQQLYDMPRQEIKIENSDKVTFFNSEISDSRINIKNNNTDNGKKEKSAFEKRVKIIGLILTGIGTVIAIILNWDSIISRFQ